MKSTNHTINEINLSHITGGNRLDDIKINPIVSPSFERRTRNGKLPKKLTPEQYMMPPIR